MKRWVIWAAAAAGVLLGLAAVAFDHWSVARPGDQVSYVIRTGNMWAGRISWSTGSPAIALTLSDGDVYAVARARRLLMEDVDGGRVFVGAYQAEAEQLVVSNLRGLQPVVYETLIAQYTDGSEARLPINVEVSLN